MAQSSSASHPGQLEVPFDASGDNVPERAIRPVYPVGARTAEAHGRVTLLVDVAKEGRVGNIKMVSGDPRYLKRALKIVRQGGQPQSSRRPRLVTIYFTHHRSDAAPAAIRPVSAVRPVYPPVAEAAGVLGTLSLLVSIDKDGSVAAVEPLTGDPLLVEAGAEAVLKWRYPPLDKPAETTVNLDFMPLKENNPGHLAIPPMAIYEPEPASNRLKDTKIAKSVGVVQLEVMVAPDGSVGDVKIIKSLDKDRDEEAISTVKTWIYLPAMMSGTAVNYTTTASIEFRLF